MKKQKEIEDIANAKRVTNMGRNPLMSSNRPYCTIRDTIINIIMLSVNWANLALG